MKLIIAIINHDDAGEVIRALTKAGFASTRVASTGGFLRAGNVTILVGVDAQRVDEAVEVIRGRAHARRQPAPSVEERDPIMPLEIQVGGATIFVVDVERFERV